jgi:hypothetical protein
MAIENQQYDFDWGKGWLPLAEDNALQTELDRELHPRHPLYGAHPAVFGRCIACDDVVASVSNSVDGPGLVVIHLTWSGRSEKPRPDGTAWPYFERVTRDTFVTRFLQGDEHL